MSAKDNNTESLGRLDRKELALIIVTAAIAIVMVTYSGAIFTAFQNTSNEITIKGEIDLGQIQTIVLVIVSGGLILLGISQGNKMATNTMKENDATWMQSEDMSILPPSTPGKRTGFSMPELFAKSLMINAYITKINEADDVLTPKEQSEAIKALAGVTAAEMEALIPLTGPALVDAIRAIIGKHRATDRTDKDKNKITS